MHLRFQSFTVVLLVALGVATISAWFTVNGLIALFSGAINSIVAMVIALEVGKITIAGWLILGRRTKLKIPLLIIMLVLMGIAGVGHFGFLSEAYNKERAVQTRTEGKVERLERQIEMLEARDTDLQTLVDRTPENYVTRRWQIWQDIAPEQEKIYKQLDSLYIVRDNLAEEELEIELSIGPYRHIAALLGTTKDNVARGVALILSLIIDPLAILLIMAGSRQTKVIVQSPSSSLPSPLRSSSVSKIKSEGVFKRLNIPSRRRKVNKAALVEKRKGPVKDRVIIAIGGSLHHAIYKLAVILRCRGSVILHLQHGLEPLESICHKLPNVQEVIIGLPGEADIILTEDKTVVKEGWVGSQYITPEEWFGLGSSLLSDVSIAHSKKVYLNLGDTPIDQDLYGLGVQLSDEDDTLMDMLITAAGCYRRCVSVGVLSALLEFTGLGYVAWVAQTDNKLYGIYLLPLTKTLSCKEEFVDEFSFI